MARPNVVTRLFLSNNDLVDTSAPQQTRLADLSARASTARFFLDLSHVKPSNQLNLWFVEALRVNPVGSRWWLHTMKVDCRSGAQCNHCSCRWWKQGQQKVVFVDCPARKNCIHSTCLWQIYPTASFLLFGCDQAASTRSRSPRPQVEPASGGSVMAGGETSNRSRECVESRKRLTSVSEWSATGRVESGETSNDISDEMNGIE